ADLLKQLAVLSRPNLADLEKKIKERNIDEEARKKINDEIKAATRVYTLDTAREVLDQLTHVEEEQNTAPPGKPLWEWWPTVLVIVGLLTVEWVGRKWAGLP